MLRIGILGTARIARKNIKAIQNSESGCIVAAVASRDFERASVYVKENCKNSNDVKVFGGSQAYQELVDSTDVCDALYMPLPTSLHKEWVVKALNAGKHVLVEKPVSVAFEDYKEMAAAAKANNRVLLDGTMFAHNPRMEVFAKHVSDESSFGTYDRITSDFCFCGDADFFKNDIRNNPSGDPLGCIGDVGWYCIRAAVICFCSYKHLRPVAAQTVHFRLSEAGVPMDAQCLVHFEQGKMLSFHCSFMHSIRERLEIAGSRHTAEMDDFVIPRKNDNKYVVLKRGFSDLDLYCDDSSNYKSIDSPRNPVQEVLMWKNFASFTASPGSGNSAKQLAISMETQRIMQALIDSIEEGGARIEMARDSNELYDKE